MQTGNKHIKSSCWNGAGRGSTHISSHLQIWVSYPQTNLAWTMRKNNAHNCVFIWMQWHPENFDMITASLGFWSIVWCGPSGTWQCSLSLTLRLKQEKKSYRPIILPGRTAKPYRQKWCKTMIKYTILACKSSNTFCTDLHLFLLCFPLKCLWRSVMHKANRGLWVPGLCNVLMMGFFLSANKGLLTVNTSQKIAGLNNYATVDKCISIYVFRHIPVVSHAHC